MSYSRVLACLFALGVLLVPTAGAASGGGIVVSQLFGGGGNAGAPFANDYVELFNRGTAPVDVGGWSVQYATAAGTSWQTTALAGTIAPGGHLLVALAGGTNGAPLPAADVTGTTNLSATGGKIALVRDGGALTCGATAGSCSANPLVEDLVGYGAATDYEGSAAAPAPSSTVALHRNDAGCADTDANAADFATGAPAPRNAATAQHPCASVPQPGPSASADATISVDVEPVLSLSLERSTVSFGTVAAGTTPPPVSERVTVLSNNASGYALTVQRTRFSPADLPLALQSTAPAGAVLASQLAGGSLVPIPVAPAALTIGTTSTAGASGGDVWPTSIGFSGPLPAVAPARYTATVTYTVIGR